MMMPPTSLQARISAFEALSTQGSLPKTPPNLLESPIPPAATAYSPIVPSPPSKSLSSRSPSPDPPNLGRKTSLIDLKDWVVDDGPSPSTSRSSGPPKGVQILPINGRAAKPSPRIVSDPVLASSAVTAPLINFDAASPPRARPAPPLPPRKPSYSSLKSASTSAANSSTSSLPRSPNSPAPPLPARKPSDTLSVDHPHTYPPPGTLGISIPTRGHAAASSISSFHSVSLSSDGGTEPPTPASSIIPIERDEATEREPDAVSLDESFENVSVTSAVSPSVASVARDWESYTRRDPPKLPQRPKSAKPPPISPPRPPSSMIPPSHLSTLLKQQPPPPAPYRPRTPSSRASTSASTTPNTSLSDRSSILSTTSGTSNTSLSAFSSARNPQMTPKPRSAPLSRPTPIPPAARRRYEALFERTVDAQRRAASTGKGRAKRPPPPPPAKKPRQAAGWRGLSVDLLVSAEDVQKMGSPPSSVAGESIEEEGPQLAGVCVRRIWTCSQLERKILRAIWSECDPGGTGTLDCAAFVQGMWRIDEELRRAQAQGAFGGARHGLGVSARSRQPKRADTLLLR